MRLSTGDQNEARQLKGTESSESLPTKPPAKNVKPPHLEALLAFVREGDAIVYHSHDRMARNLDDLRRIVLELTQRGIHVTSITGLITAPGYSIYNSSKFAVEGLSEGLWYDLGSFGIKVKVVEPGVASTEFRWAIMDVLDTSRLPDCASVTNKIKAGRARLIKKRSEPDLIAATIYEAANDQSDRLRYLAGPDAKRLWSLRRWLGYRAQMRIVRNLLKLWK